MRRPTPSAADLSPLSPPGMKSEKPDLRPEQERHPTHTQYVSQNWGVAGIDIMSSSKTGPMGPHPTSVHLILITDVPPLASERGARLASPLLAVNTPSYGEGVGGKLEEVS